MKRILVAVVMVLVFVQMGAQEQRTDSVTRVKNSVFVELLGRGDLYSINYDRIFLIKNKHAFTARIGFSYYPPNDSHQNYFCFPVAVNYMYGIKHHLEISAGLTSRFEQEERALLKHVKSTYSAMFGIGYRYQRVDGGVFFRIEIIEFFPKYEASLPLWGGLGIGYTFKQQTA